MPASQRTLERRIRTVYTEAQKDLQKKLDDYIVKFRAKDAQMRQDLAEQAITQKEYDEWRQGAIFQGKAWRARLKQVTDTLANANEESLRLVRGEQLNEFAEGMNHEQFVLAQNTGLSINFGIYDAETVGKLIREQPDLLPPKKLNRGKDERWNQKKVTGSILQGIIQGESIDDIAKRIARDTARQNSKAMIRYARTATTGAQNAGRMETMHRAKGMGINVRKQWLATLDGRTRDSHRHLDGQVKDIDDHFDSDYGKIMFPGDPSAHPGDVYNCFVGETNIATDSEIIRSYKHDYSGKLITVKTSSGVEFTCTPNHPILTPSGWVAAERLQDRNNLLIASIGEDDPLRINPYIEHAFTRIDAIHQLFDEMGSKRTARLGVNFHGDVPTTDVEIITQKRFLRNNRDSGCADGVNKLLLKHSDESLMGKGAFVQHFGSVWFAALRFMCGFGKALSLFGRRVIHAVVHGFRPIAGSDATVLQAQSDDVTGDVQFLRESLDGFSGKVFVDNIVNIKITTVSHVPVYNLQTSNSRYFVNSIIAQNGEKCNGKFAIAHNCRCTLIYVYPDYPTDPGERLDNITGEHVRGDMTYAEWAGQQPAAQHEKKPEEKLKKPGKKLAGVEQGEPMTHEQADTGRVNPNYGTQTAYNINCQSCVVAYEARLRGYDIEVVPNDAAHPMCRRLSRDTRLAWKDRQTGETPDFMFPYRPTLSSKWQGDPPTPKRFRQMLEESVQEGGRYHLGFGWKGSRRSGHIVTMGKRNNELYIYDPQSDRTYTGKAFDLYLARLKMQTTSYGYKYYQWPEVLRVDDKDIDYDVAGQVVRSREK